MSENASWRQRCSRYCKWDTPCGKGPTTNRAVAQSWVVPVKSVIWVKKRLVEATSCSQYLKLRYGNASWRQHSYSQYPNWDTPCGKGPTTNRAVAQSWVVPVKSVIWVKKCLVEATSCSQYLIWDMEMSRGGNTVVADIPTEIPPVAKGQLLTGQFHSLGWCP